MEETLQHQETAQCSGLPPTGPGNHRSDVPKAGHALTFKLDHSNGADQLVVTVGQDYSGNVSPEPPNSVGKSLNLGRPSLIEIVFSL